MGKCDLLLGGRVVGKASWHNDGNAWRLHASCPFEEGYIYRLMLDLPDGDTKIMGVMVPEYGKFVIDKQLSPMQAKALGPELRAIQGAEVIRTKPGEPVETGPLPFPTSAFEPFDPARLPSADAALRQELEGSGALMRFHDGGTYIAAPLEEGAPFALNSVFCLATPLKLGGKWYGLVRVEPDGSVSMVHIQRRGG